MFFYLYMLVTIMDLLLISGIIPTASNLYPVSGCSLRIKNMIPTLWTVFANNRPFLLLQ